MRVTSLYKMATRKLILTFASTKTRTTVRILSQSRQAWTQKSTDVLTRVWNCCQQSIRFASTDRESLMVTVDDVSFHCETTGTGSHHVLLLPGALGCSTTDYEPQLEKMSKEKFTLFSFDPRGYGKSIPPERDWPLEYFRRDADDAAAVMKKLVGERKYSVMGWSDGGIMGLILAAKYSDRVDKLVVWGSNSYISEKDMKMVSAVEDISTWSPRMREPFIKVYGEEYFQKHWSNFIKAYRMYYNKLNGDICCEDLKRITCPTFILHGDKDPMVDNSHPEYLLENINNSILHRMPEGKHNIHMKYADEFNKLVEQFLQIY